MESVQIRKIILTIMLIVKDAIMWMIRCLIATILFSVCVENGWILSNYATDVSYTMFWKLYSVIFILVPLIIFYRGITGKYFVEIKEYKSEFPICVAKNKQEKCKILIFRGKNNSSQ